MISDMPGAFDLSALPSGSFHRLQKIFWAERPSSEHGFFGFLLLFVFSYFLVR